MARIRREERLPHKPGLGVTARSAGKWPGLFAALAAAVVVAALAGALLPLAALALAAGSGRPETPPVAGS